MKTTNELLLRTEIMCIIVIFTALSRATAIPGIEKYRGPDCSCHNTNASLIQYQVIYMTSQLALMHITLGHSKIHVSPQTPQSGSASQIPNITQVRYTHCKYDPEVGASCSGFLKRSKHIRHEVYHFRV